MPRNIDVFGNIENVCNCKYKFKVLINLQPEFWFAAEMLFETTWSKKLDQRTWTCPKIAIAIKKLLGNTK